MLQLKKFPDIPVSTREEVRESRPHPEEPNFRLLAREEGSFPCVFRKELPTILLHLKRRHSPQERREELQGRATIPRVPQMSQFIAGKPVFPALPRLSSRGSTHTTVTRGKALWESLVGKPRGKATDPLIHAKGSVTLLLQLGRKAHVHAPNSRRGLTPLGRLQTYLKIHVSTGGESSGSGTDFTHGYRPRQRRERKPERPPSNSHGDWPFQRPPERVPEVPFLSREHLPQLENIQEVLPRSRGEAHFR